MACINNGRIVDELGQFCSPLGVVLDLQQDVGPGVREMIQSSLDAIAGLCSHIHTLVVDERRQ
jgi:hypothetical protein